MPDPLIGRQLGKYQIQLEIGRGGMARVYRAIDTVLQRPVALKVLAPSLSADPEFARRFEREAITAANLRHPAIVTIFDVGEADGLRYIAMEYIAGRTLSDVIGEVGKLGLPLTIAITSPVAEALDFAHNHGMVHRDVKPHNIMLDTDGRVLLTDFGIAIDPGENTERLTRTGMFMGTPEYISPEQAQAQPLGGRSDQYSLGIVTYEMLVGRVPFEGGTPQQIMAHVYQTPPPLTGFDRSSPPELDQIFGRVLAKDPNQRFERVSQLVEALRYVARRYGMNSATRDEVAALAVPHGSSAGQATVAMQTPTGQQPQRGPAARPAQATPAGSPPAPFPIGGVFPNNAAAPTPGPTPTGARTQPGRYTPPANPAVGPGTGYTAGARTPGGTTGGQRQPTGRSRSYGGDDQFVPPPRVPRRPNYDDGGGSSVPWTVLALGAIAAIAVLLVIVLTRENDGIFANNPLPSRSPLFVSTPTLTPLPTNTPFPTLTPVTIVVSTTVPGQPTPTPEVLTATPEPTIEPTAEPTIEPTVEPTAEPTVEPTIEPTVEPTIEPTAEPTPTEQATATPTSTTPPGVPTAVGGGGELAYFADSQLRVRDQVTGSVPKSLLLALEPQGPPAISPDRLTTLIDAIDPQTGERQIYAFDDKSRLTVLTQGPGDSFQPMWSPDGSQIVFASNRGGPTHLYIMDRDGQNQEPLTQGPGNDQYPSFAPGDGDQRILFESNRDDPKGALWAIYTLNLQDSIVTRVSPPNLAYSERSPRWSPDGTTIAFIANPDRSDGFNVYTQRLDQIGNQQLTLFDLGTVNGPTWSPDGTLIAFFGDNTGSNDLYIVAADGSSAGGFLTSPASDPAVEETWPSWN